MKKEWEWRFYLSWLLRETIGMTQEDKGKFLDSTIIALQSRERGLTAFADKVIDRADELSAKQRDNRVAGGGGEKSMVNHGEPRLNHGKSMVNHGRTYENEDEDEETKSDKPKPKDEPHPPADAKGSGTAAAGGFGATNAKGEVSVGGSMRSIVEELGLANPKSSPRDPVVECLRNPKEGIHNLPALELPRFMVEFCGERGNALTAGTFKKYFRELGNDGFRTVAAAFVAECAVGEEPSNRGAAFTARLKKAVEDG